ncbi:MAG: hypothetical protein HeimC2_18840 [Candidatus Heimdallarchaeota archaeon LC_2]|nr:MAG: hypothetical protein HeimC2_18840 [Candidatus Heimdallarchaeota archaeon LC_2]
MFARLKSRRALSPVITTIFLMGIIVAAIGVTLGIILPNMDKLNDQLDLETNSSNLIVLDENFREMMLNGYTNKLFYTMDLGASGFLMGDISSTSIIKLMYKDTDPQGNIVDVGSLNRWAPQGIPTQFNNTQNRLMIRQNLNSDVISSNTNQYLIGSGDQNIFFLNSTKRASVSWSILNQSRFSDSKVYTSLSYRNLISTEKTISNQNLDVNLTVIIQRVIFKFTNNLNSSNSFINMQAEYTGLNVTTYEWTTIPNAGVNDRSFYIQTITDLQFGTNLINNQINTEFPYSNEIPGLGTLNVRMQFIDHIIEILI